jgi:hypothetical protein
MTYLSIAAVGTRSRILSVLRVTRRLSAKGADANPDGSNPSRGGEPI